MSIYFAFINIYGYLLYSVYVFTGIIYPDIGTNHVPIQDVFYVTHAIMLSSVYYTQSVIYPNGKQKISKAIWSLLIASLIMIAVLFSLEMNNISTNKRNVLLTYFYKYRNAVMLYGYLKDIITV